jgi:ATP-dependent Lon protease
MNDPNEGIRAEGDAPGSADEKTLNGEVVGQVSSLPARQIDSLPTRLPVLVSPAGPPFPGMMTLLPTNDARTKEALQNVGPFVGLVAARPEQATDQRPVQIESLYDIGCVGQVARPLEFPDGSSGVAILPVRRMRIRRFLETDPVLIAEMSYPEERVEDQRELAALFSLLRSSFSELAQTSPEIPTQLGEMLGQLGEPGPTADLIAANLARDVATRQEILSDLELCSRLRRALLVVEKQLDLAKLGAKLQEEIRSQIEEKQKEHFLREQLQVIRKELGEEVDQRELDRKTYETKITEARMPGEAEQRARKELDRLSVLPAEAAEYHVIRNYLDWLVEIPWSKECPEQLDIERARRVLDEDHHGLEQVKERIVEFLAVRKLRPDQQGAILCLVGPPGVGKSSLGRSVARATGRDFYRVSLGGMRDEAEIKGHRRTYVGAMPGKIIQGLRRVGTRNPVFMLDELDKLGSDWRGDPSSALLEVLDPAQNDVFEDLFIDLPFDLSQVMFVATANVASEIPAPLLDRTEVITLSGYIPAEKREIGRKYLLPRQLEAHGLKPSHLKVPVKTMSAIIDGYTREAGVRELERVLGRACRKVAANLAALPDPHKAEQVVLAKENLVEYLGPQRYFTEVIERCRRPGVVMGLAWTAFGGEILFIEATSMAGQGRLELTGKLGDVMSESVRIAYSLVKSRADQYQIPPRMLKELDIHLHVPAGAVPKDGPSAGVAMICALLSLLWKGKGKCPKTRVAMTGEITLRGAVLPVGGIKEKVIGAKRAGVKTVVLPKKNEPDVKEIGEAIVRGLSFVYVDDVDQAIRAVLGPVGKRT